MSENKILNNVLLHSPIYFTSLFLCLAEVEPNDTCPPLPQIAFGWNSLSHSSPVRSSVMTYQCQPGYDIIGTDVITCQWDLSWNGNPPTCVKGVTNGGTPMPLVLVLRYISKRIT